MARVLERELKGNLCNHDIKYKIQDKHELIAWKPYKVDSLIGGIMPKYVIDRIDIANRQLWGHEQGRDRESWHDMKIWEPLRKSMTTEEYQERIREMITVSVNGVKTFVPETYDFKISCEMWRGAHYQYGHSHFDIEFTVQELWRILQGQDVRFSKLEYLLYVMSRLPSRVVERKREMNSYRCHGMKCMMDNPEERIDLEQEDELFRAYYHRPDFVYRDKTQYARDYLRFQSHVGERFMKLYDSMK
jgi:hypothetical protein